MEDGVFHDDIGSGEGRIRVASRGHPVKRLVVGGVLVQLGRTRLHGCLGTDHRGQRVVVHIDQFQCVLCLVAVLSYHYRHRVTLITDHILGQGRVVNRFDVGLRWDPGAWDGVQNSVGVCTGVNRYHARRGRSRSGVYTADLGMGMGAPLDSCV